MTANHAIEAGLDSVEALIEPLTTKDIRGIFNGFLISYPKSAFAQPELADPPVRLAGPDHGRRRGSGLHGLHLAVLVMKIAILGILLGLLAALFAGNVRAHDNPDNWIGIERRTNAVGQLCCGRGDCRPYSVDEVKVMPDGYHFPDGEIVPFGKVAPSIDHFYWKCSWGGETKCTFAPLGAS